MLNAILVSKIEFYNEFNSFSSSISLLTTIYLNLTGGQVSRWFSNTKKLDGSHLCAIDRQTQTSSKVKYTGNRYYVNNAGYYHYMKYH